MQYTPKNNNIIDMSIRFEDSHTTNIDSCKFYKLPNNLCTQTCCLKNHNIGIVECNENCSNRTTILKMN